MALRAYKNGVEGAAGPDAHSHQRAIHLIACGHAKEFAVEFTTHVVKASDRAMGMQVHVVEESPVGLVCENRQILRRRDKRLRILGRLGRENSRDTDGTVVRGDGIEASINLA